MKKDENKQFECNLGNALGGLRFSFESDTHELSHQRRRPQSKKKLALLNSFPFFVLSAFDSFDESKCDLNENSPSPKFVDFACQCDEGEIEGEKTSVAVGADRKHIVFTV